MFLKTVGFLAIPLLLLHAGSALAFVDGEVLVGNRWYQLDTTPKENVTSQEIMAAAHIDPIPFVPVSFGADVTLGTLKKGDLPYSGISQAKTFEAALDVMAWIPMVPVITPYVRVRLPVVGTWTEEFTAPDINGNSVKYEATSKISGYDLHVGAKWSPIPLVRIMAEVGKGMETLKPDEYKVAGTKTSIPDSKSQDLGSSLFMVGVEVGI